MKIDSSVGLGEKRYGLWETESGSREEEDGVRPQKVLDKEAEKGSVSEWMSRSPEKASKATLQDRPPLHTGCGPRRCCWPRPVRCPPHKA